MEQEISTSLTLEDIKLLAGLIDTCSTRGVFRANEFIPVGTVFNKLIVILQSAEQKNK
jgi:hypothetical protein